MKKKKCIILIALLFFSCSSDNPISQDIQELISGQIIFEFEAPPPYRISYPEETLSTNISDLILPNPSDPIGQVLKTTRTLNYQLPPFARFNITMDLKQFSGYMIMRVFLKTDSKYFVFTSKDFTSDGISLVDTIEIPF